MKAFNLFFLQLVSFTLLCGCNSENAKDEQIISNAEKPFTVCCDNLFAVSDGEFKEDNLTRGWEGDVEDDAQNLPQVYPLNKIYMIANKKFGQDWSDYSVLEFPVYELDGKKVFDICFSAEGMSVWAKNGIDSIKVTEGFSYQPFFSSVPTIDVSQELCDVTTPGNKQTYEPYGDRLFKSTFYNFIAMGDMIYTGDFKPITEMTLEMQRLTNVFVPRLVISDDLEDENRTEYVLDEKIFVDSLGVADDWQVRCFFALKKDVAEQGIVLDYNIIEGLNPEGPNKGIVSLSENYQSLQHEFVHSSISIGGIHTVYKGVGFHSDSKPFILPIPSLDKVDLCYSFRYVGNDERIKSQYKQENTFLFHNIAGKKLYELNEGDLTLFTVVIDIDDFIDAFRKSSVESRSQRGVHSSTDPFFGEVSEVPYKIIVE